MTRSLHLPRNPLDLLRQPTHPERVRGAFRNDGQRVAQGEKLIGNDGVGKGWQASPTNRKFHDIAACLFRLRHGFNHDKRGWKCLSPKMTENFSAGAV